MGSEALPTLDPGRQEEPIRFSNAHGRYLRFGAFILDQHRQELFKNGARLKLQGKAYQVLLTLLERPGEVISREELRHRLWPSDTHVNFDANVNTTVNKLRQALDDSPEEPTYIETIPRKGYSFVAAVEPAEAPSTLRPVHPAVVPPPPNGKLAAAETTVYSLKSFPIWITVGVAALIATGMLLGAGVAMYWITHTARFTPLH